MSRYEPDPEYAEAAIKNVRKGYNASQSDGRILFIKMCIPLIGWPALAPVFAPDVVVLAGVVAISALCICWVIIDRVSKVELDIIHVGGAVEWFGQKALDKVQNVEEKEPS